MKYEYEKKIDVLSEYYRELLKNVNINIDRIDKINKSDLILKYRDELYWFLRQKEKK